MKRSIPGLRGKRGQTSAQDAEQRLALHYGVAQALAESDTVAEMAALVLRHVGRHLGGASGVYWDIPSGGGQPAAIATWSPQSAEALAPPARITHDPALAQAVAAAGTARWVADAAADGPASDGRTATGFRSAFAFPVRSAKDVIGVIEFVSRRQETENRGLIEAADAIGVQIGQFVERKRAIERERAAESRNASIVEIALDAVVTMDHRGRIIEFNPAAERIFGYAREAVLGRPMAEAIIPPHLRPHHYTGMRRYLATGEAHVLGRRIEIEAMRADGTVFPVELAISRVPGPGEPVFTSYIRDLTEERRASARRRLLLDAGAVLAASLDPAEMLRGLSRIILPGFADWYFVDTRGANGDGTRRLQLAHRDPQALAEARRLAGRTGDGAALDGLLASLRSDRTEWAARLEPDAIERLAADPAEADALRALGLASYVVVPLIARGTVLGNLGLVSGPGGRRYDPDDVATAEELGRRAGDALAHARLFADLTEHRQLLQRQQSELEAQSAELEEAAQALEEANEELRRRNEDLRARTTEALRAKEEADGANRAKSAFLAAMSHELRTPLNAIMGYADLLHLGVGGALSDEQRERLERIKRSAQHLLGLINDVLKFARLEAGKLTYDIQPMPIAAVLRSAEENVAPQIAARQIRYEVQDLCDGEICADRDKLLQILLNLLTNAVRHTPPRGRIVVKCERREAVFQISVRDTGPGIAPDKLEAIFQPFTQIEDPYVGPRTGTGLGLAISRELARAMHGDLVVRSRVGVGSEFIVTLPAQR